MARFLASRLHMVIRGHSITMAQPWGTFHSVPSSTKCHGQGHTPYKLNHHLWGEAQQEQVQVWGERLNEKHHKTKLPTRKEKEIHV